MSAPVLLQSDDMIFAMDTPPEIHQLLLMAVKAWHDTERAERFLNEAMRLDPRRLEVYIAMYKFYFYKNQLLRAEQTAHSALLMAARLGGFDEDWRRLDRASADWGSREGPPRAYLYTLKALAFIRLRLDDSAGGDAILDKMRDLDPDDQVGASVLRDLADGIRGEPDEEPG